MSKNENMETIKEEFTVAGKDFVKLLERMVHDISVHQLIVRSPNGRKIFEVPSIVPALGMLAVPPLGLLGVGLALVGNLKVELIRQVDSNETVVDQSHAVEEITVDDLDGQVKIQQCQGTTKSGSQCKRKPVEDGAFCAQHSA